MSHKYCELYIAAFDIRLGFPDPGVRAQASAMHHLLHYSSMSAMEAIAVFRKYGVICTDPLSGDKPKAGILPNGFK